MERKFCQDCADIELGIRVQAEADKAADQARYGDNLPPDKRHAADGQRWTMRVLTADDKAAEAEAKPQGTTRRGRRPTPRRSGK